MGKLLPEIGDKEAAFIASQKVFFVATAPLSNEHHVSVSPKSPGNSCVVLDPRTVAYADLTGSGAETAAHVLQNGRMTLLFCNLAGGPPKILRLFGKAELILAEDVSPQLRSKFPKEITESFGFRAVYKLHVSRVTTSCGYTMPIMSFQKHRRTLEEWCQGKGKDGMFEYATNRNSFSIDGLPSVALLRKNCPANIEPVVQDGYVLGESNDDQSVEENRTDIIRKAMKEAHRMHITSSRRINLHAGELIVVCCLCLALGVGLGVFCCKE